jgi:large subunit ribosomal protein L25
MACNDENRQIDQNFIISNLWYNMSPMSKPSQTPANTHTLDAQVRDLKLKPKALRRDGLLPANVSGTKGSQALSVSLSQARQLLADISESTVFYLHLGSKPNLPVMISEVQYHPVTSQLLHLGMRQVNLRQKVTASIPISVTGEFSIPDAVYLLVKDEIEAEALPTDLPEEFVIDVSRFTAIGDQFTFADLNYDHQKVTLNFESEEEPIIVVNAVKVEVEEPEPAPADTAATPDNASPTPDSPETPPAAS